VHGLGRQKNVGQEYLVFPELLAHDVHPGQETLIEDLLWGKILLDCRARQFGDLLLFAQL